MKVILDENLPRPLKGIFPNHTVTTVQEQGLAGTHNGALLVRFEGDFDLPTISHDVFSTILPVVSVADEMAGFEEDDAAVGREVEPGGQRPIGWFGT